MPEPRRVDRLVPLLLVCAETVGEMHRHRTGVRAGIHVEVLSLVTDFGERERTFENVVAAHREARPALVERPLDTRVDAPRRGDVVSPLDGRALIVAREVERQVGFAAQTDRVVHAHHPQPFGAVERQVVKGVAALGHPHPGQRQPGIEPFARAQRYDDVGAPLAVGVPVERLVDQCQAIRGLPCGLVEVVGHLVPEQHEDILLLIHVHCLAVVAFRRPQSGRAPDLRIAVDVGGRLLHLPVRGIGLVRRE